MAEREQSYKNHTRNFPLFHFIAVPILLANFANAIRHVVQNPEARSSWFALLVAFGILAMLFASRVMAITVQNRVIRLEMRQRLAQVLPADLKARITDLTVGQLVALRFAGDGELPALVKDTLDGKLATAKDIKLAIKNWQADWLRA
jgi:hypothetical protein